MSAHDRSSLRARARIGKYKIEARIAIGGFAEVFRAFDTIEGIQVALKIPFPHLVDKETLDAFRREVRLTARLDHPHILPLKNADFVDGRFVLAYPLGAGSLGDRLQRRLATSRAIDYGGQILEALAYAHSRRIVHCDVKPDNLILFPEDRLRLSDFGIAKVMLRTLRASGSGTVGYLAPEQAMGRPAYRSDVFSAGLILYRMLTGVLPEWPYAWPPPRFDALRRKVPREMIDLLRRSLEVDQRRRFDNAITMQQAFQRLLPATRRHVHGRRRRPAKKQAPNRDWRQIRHRDFRRRYGAALDARHACPRCEGPMAEAMQACPWCGRETDARRLPTRMPRRCPRCRRGVKSDWTYCPYCYGASIGPASDRVYDDRRYTRRCSKPGCRHPQFPFMRYCPGCRSKITVKWKIPGNKSTCTRCGWPVLSDYWKHCPWCSRTISKG
jgi:serine/threonine-protein kinase